MFKKIAPHLQKGQHGEQLAHRYLKQQGLTIVAKNVRNRYGEIDLIAQDNQSLVFIEVRLRQHNALVSACQSIDPRKQQKWQKAAQHYLQTHYRQPPDCRFDAICITEHPKQAPQIDWLKGIFL
ncbi:YraN family protein [Rappaport israeli]|uniref:YraN family protein n=1 Tax=Rappaport israeli TaxID=1839807 RepID=UPI0009304156|nr:YraN family protein [Rappaport israeli]